MYFSQLSYLRKIILNFYIVSFLFFVVKNVIFYEATMIVYVNTFNIFFGKLNKTGNTMSIPQYFAYLIYGAIKLKKMFCALP